MKMVELARTGQQVSQLAIGGMLMGTSTDDETSIELLNRYAAAGGTFVDTANCYAWGEPGRRGGESETVIGRWLRQTGRRDDIFLATKGGAWIDDPDAVRDQDWSVVEAHFEGAAGATLTRAIDDSLRRLQVDHVDLYYVHVDDRSVALEETLEALAAIVTAGKARYLGYSNVHTWRFERIRQLCVRHGWPEPVALQQQHSYLRRRAGLSNASIVDDEQLNYLRANPEVALVSYSPILRGSYEPRKRAGHWAMDPYLGADTDARLAALDAVAAELGATANQVVMAWLLHQSDPTVIPIAGPRTLEQYDEAIAAVDLKLSADQLSRLNDAGA